MTVGFLFWLLMIFWLIFGLWWYWPSPPQGPAWYPLGHGVMLFVLLFLLGLHTFGFPIHG